MTAAVHAADSVFVYATMTDSSACMKQSDLLVVKQSYMNGDMCQAHCAVRTITDAEQLPCYAYCASLLLV